MLNENVCQECSQKDNCRRAYENLGNIKGPSVTMKSIVAFLIPLIIFLLTLGIFERFFQKAIGSKKLQVAIGFLAASTVTIIYIMIVKLISGHIKK